MNLAVLHIDDKWSVEYDSTNNDRPVNLLRYGKRMTFSPQDWSNLSMAMFYALLSNSISVKHLKWSERQKNGDTTAQSVVGEYSVGEVHGHHMVMLRIGERDICIARVAGFEEAKAAAQADFERRILSALE